MTNKPQRKSWSVWRVLAGASVEDTYLANLFASSFPSDDRVLPDKLEQDDALMIRAYGQHASAPDNKTAVMRISGWMKGNDRYGRGQGVRLWDGTITLGNIALTAPPLTGTNWDTAENWHEVDTYGSTSNLAKAASVVVADACGVLVLPALGFSDIICEVASKDGSTGTEALSIGILYRIIPVALAYLIIESQ